tara:strand:+ start:315 stop:554 length:240 start_codon:yes stop_codon:yes gene_type:complete
MEQALIDILTQIVRELYAMQMNPKYKANHTTSMTCLQHLLTLAPPKTLNKVKSQIETKLVENKTKKIQNTLDKLIPMST